MLSFRIDEVHYKIRRKLPEIATSNRGLLRLADERGNRQEIRQLLSATNMVKMD